MMKQFPFLLAVWKTNLLSVMEYRVSFLSQAIGMMVNNAFYFLVWIIFFDRFNSVHGWGLTDMFVTFGITSTAFGIVSLLFGNAFVLGDIITKGRLDYYLSFPRPVLLHALTSRSIASGMGDFTYGFLSFAASGVFTWSGLARFVLAVMLAAAVLAAFLIIVQSLAFWLGTTSYISAVALNAMLTFAIYPISLFETGARLILFTLIPAAFMGAVPASFVRNFRWDTLLLLLAGAFVLLGICVAIFQMGLRRYESGSAFQIEI